jgi:hypothetical protein
LESCILTLKRNEHDVISLLSVLEKLIVEPPPFGVEQTGLYEMAVEGGTHSRVLFERLMTLE